MARMKSVRTGLIATASALACVLAVLGATTNAAPPHQGAVLLMAQKTADRVPLESPDGDSVSQRRADRRTTIVIRQPEGSGG